MAGLFADANLEHLSEPKQSVCIKPMETFGQSYGFILYSTFIPGPRQGQQLHIQEVRDRAQVFLDGRPLGVIERWNLQPLDITVPATGARLDILVENMGRINYGPLIHDPKGITEGVRIDNQFLYNWTVRTLPLASQMLSSLSYKPVMDKGQAEHEELSTSTSEDTGLPGFYRGSFQVEDIGDTFLRFDGWTKGVAWINGFNLGRYWNAGPQKALYIPGPLLRKGENELVLFELHGGPESCEVELSDQPDLGQTAAVDEAVLNFVQDEEDK